VKYRSAAFNAHRMWLNVPKSCSEYEGVKKILNTLNCLEGLEIYPLFMFHESIKYNSSVFSLFIYKVVCKIIFRFFTVLHCVIILKTF
jgi:hypothetical protein